MAWKLQDLRIFLAASEAGSFTDAAIDLKSTQATVSRSIARLERTVGGALFLRVQRGCELTPLGASVVPYVRRLLAEAERLDEFVRTRHGRIRLGYAWAALGSLTMPLQKQWAVDHAETRLELTRHNSPTAGLAEGLCDVAVVRRTVDERMFESRVVGEEPRMVAFAAGDPTWSRRRRLTMAEIASRTVVVDPRAGTTTRELWAGFGQAPAVIETADVDSWLDAIAAGRGVGTTAASTAYHHPRPGILYRPIKDGPPITVRVAWRRDARPAHAAVLAEAIADLFDGADPGRDRDVDATGYGVTTELSIGG